MKYYATRDLSKCTKDCLCLYVCPTGATDTENGQVDFEKCIGCGACVNACPSRALTLLPWDYPKEQIHEESVIKRVMEIFRNKEKQVEILRGLKVKTDLSKALIKALEISTEVQAEDLIREAGYMLPDGLKAKEFYEELKEANYGIDKNNLSELGKLIKMPSLGSEVTKKEQTSQSEKYRCTICGYVYDDAKEKVAFKDLPDDWACPICGAPKSAFEKIVD